MANKLADISLEELAMYFSFLDDLRESGQTNMFGARPYLVREYGIAPEKAGRVLSAWMGSDLSVEVGKRAENVLVEAAT